MPSFEIHLLSHARAARSVHREARGIALASAADLGDRGAEGLDVAVDGERVSAATRPEHAACVVRDLVAAAVVLAEGRAAKALVPFYDTPWEICLAAGDDALLVSLYRTGPAPEVRALDHPVAVADLVAQARAAARDLGGTTGDGFATDLGALLDRLDAAASTPLRRPARGAATLIRWASRDRSATASGREAAVGVRFQAVVPGAPVAAPGPHPAEARVEAAQADLHALLVRGRVGLALRGQVVDLAQGFVVLQVERLLALCRPLIEAWAARRALHLRANVGGATLGLRLGTDERLALTISRAPDVQQGVRPGAPHGPGGGTVTVPALDPRALVGAVLEGALALAAAVVRCDRGLARNLRLRALRTEARTLRWWLRGLDRPDTKINPDPALYRAVAATVAARAPGELDLGGATRLRYSERWRAEIEGIDLAGTLLCGDRLVVPGARELRALDRATGASVWSLPVPRAATTLAGDGILRLSPRGEVELRAVATGEVLWSARIAPRVGAAAMAFAVTAPGVARLVVLAEGERRLVALDLRTGEARWTYTARHGGTFRMRRAGRLLVVVSGDSAVTAIDLATGEPVWRYGDRVPFATTPLVYRDQVVVVPAGDGGRGPARLYALGAYTGELQWCAEADAPACCPPVATGDTVALTLSTRDGAALAGFDVATGRERFRTALGALTGASGARPAATAFDDLVVVNLPTGRVVAIGAAGGETRWVQSFRAPVADDVPRRLDPQLRAGALFVPQSSLAVLRPRDGSVLAEVEACDLVPDLVRVDEQCALYVAEESGHVGCYELGARLRVIRSV